LIGAYEFANLAIGVIGLMRPASASRTSSSVIPHSIAGHPAMSRMSSAKLITVDLLVRHVFLVRDGQHLGH
jgi:hypothetical protein